MVADDTLLTPILHVLNLVTNLLSISVHFRITNCIAL